MTVEELHSRLRQGKVYQPEKVEQALANLFRETNIATFRELALRAVADEVGEKAASRRQREGLEPALIPERVMVCMSSSTDAPRVLRAGARIAGRLGARRYAVYVETPQEAPGRIQRPDRDALQRNITLAEELGATVVRVRADRPADGLIAFAQREGITHVVFGQSARSRWEILIKGSTLNRFLQDVRDATVQVVPVDETAHPVRSATRSLMRETCGNAVPGCATVSHGGCDGREQRIRQNLNRVPTHTSPENPGRKGLPGELRTRR